MVRSHSDARKTRRRSLALCCVVLAVIATGTVSCTPPTPPFDPTSLPKDIDLMTDAQVEQALTYLAPQLTADFNNPKVKALIPPKELPLIQQEINELQTQDGIASLVPTFRQLASTTLHGLPARTEAPEASLIGLSDGSLLHSPVTPTDTGVRVPPPTGPGTRDSAGNVVGADVTSTPSSAPCAAPGGIGTVAAPTTAVTAGQLLTPGHDVFTKTSTGFAVGSTGPLSVTGVVGPDGGVQLRTVGLNQQMHVQIDLEDPKQFGPAALYPLIDIKPIGGDQTSEFRATVTGGRIYCYANDTRTDRGYFDGWVNIPRGEPGFQLIDEVVENDYFFRCTLDNLAHCDASLAGAGPQYWAGADRATIHAGAAALTSPNVLPASVGAFVTALPDGTSGDNALTDTDGNPGNDLEGALRSLIDNEIRSSVDGALAGDLFNIGIASAQASLNKPITDSIDLSFQNGSTGLTEPNEPAGATGFIHADITVNADVNLNVDLLSLECDNLDTTATVTLHANAWVDSHGDDTGLNPGLDDSDLNADVSTNPSTVQYFNPICDLESLATAVDIGNAILGHEVSSGLHDAFAGTDKKPGIDAELGALDLDQYLPSIPIGGTVLKPFLTNIDNSWCQSTGAPAGCSNDQDLIGALGPDVVGDSTMISSLGQTFGNGFGGKFPNVFNPTTYSTVADLTTGHRDINQQLAGIGALVDPRLINETLRDVVEGDSTSPTSNGLLDISNVQLGTGYTLNTSPTSAPEILGVPPGQIAACPGPGQCGSPYPSPPSRATVPIIEPDLRANVTVGPNSGPPVLISLGVSANAGVTADPANPLQLHPSLDAAEVDPLITGNCKANYTTGYATSYFQCGRGDSGTGGNDSNGKPISLTSLITYVANDVVLPLAEKSIGGITLPSLGSLLPGFAQSLTNVRLNQRGGFLAVYADLRPTPQVAIAISTEQDNGETYIRFFPTNVNGFDSGPVHFAWQVSDHVTGQPVATIPVPGDPVDAVMTDVNNFATTDTDFGSGKEVDVTLVATQPGLEATARIDPYSWVKPTVPPPGTCPNNPVILAHPALDNGPGGGGGGSAPGCPV